MLKPINRRWVDIAPLKNRFLVLKFVYRSIPNSKLTWKVIFDDKIVHNAVIPSTEIKAKRYWSTRNISWRQRTTDWMNSFPCKIFRINQIILKDYPIKIILPLLWKCMFQWKCIHVCGKFWTTLWKIDEMKISGFWIILYHF